jgi:hypothetical protein
MLKCQGDPGVPCMPQGPAKRPHPWDPVDLACFKRMPGKEYIMKTSNRAERSSTNRAGGRKGRGRSGRQSGTGSELLSAVNDAVGDSLTETVNNMKERVSEQVVVHGERYLVDAGKRISEATAKVVKWGKEHPMKTAAAAAALVAVSTFLYSTLGKTAAASGAGGSRR